MNIKKDFSEYTRTEFSHLITAIKSNQISASRKLGLIMHFDKIVGHPEGADLIFFPEVGADDSIEGITRAIETWRAHVGLPGFNA
ncbi:bacteriocin immunity protein [Pseudomonas sp. NPDC086278]|uniref:bacteriocin immunity protein n=1 Tax=Pseudomonas sp. NPDC086278 TaxID=3390646 RepID=UPI003D051D3F